MNKNEQVANIIAFLSILFGEDSDDFSKIMDFSPDYIIEKFNRYIESSRIEHPWGLHPGLKGRTFHIYMKKWGIELQDEYGA